MTDASREDIAHAILGLCRARGPTKTICPSEAARRVSAPGTDWRPLMPRVREVAGQLAEDGVIVGLQKGQTIDISSARGAIRLRLGKDG